ncbi:hypothetical protein AB0J83_22715 [Actinoplanes sp. NPDC049596]|uniref:hypothetical protein n=1 Tax=unclassified Actinoplanes TaxID=2626549 RepID=UPI003434A1AE
MHVVALVIGMILLVLGAQGGIRLLADHDNTGVLSWLPGGFGPAMAGFAVLVVAGVLLAGWGSDQLKKRRT